MRCFDAIMSPRLVQPLQLLQMLVRYLSWFHLQPGEIIFLVRNQLSSSFLIRAFAIDWSSEMLWRLISKTCLAITNEMCTKASFDKNAWTKQSFISHLSLHYSIRIKINTSEWCFECRCWLCRRRCISSWENNRNITYTQFVKSQQTHSHLTNGSKSLDMVFSFCSSNDHLRRIIMPIEVGLHQFN